MKHLSEVAKEVERLKRSETNGQMWSVTITEQIQALQKQVNALTRTVNALVAETKKTK